MRNRSVRFKSIQDDVPRQDLFEVEIEGQLSNGHRLSHLGYSMTR